MTNTPDAQPSNNPFGGLDLGSLMDQVQQMKDRLVDAQENLKTRTFCAESGGGLVKATVNGEGDLIELVISPEACDPDATDVTADLVVAAVRAAQGQFKSAVTQSMPGLGGFGF